jgi:predicted nuclease of restriction endonuclease-like (RecB) superfamily
MPTKRVGTRTKRTPGTTTRDYDEVLSGVVELLEQARRAAARSVNVIMTATYWEIGRRIVEFEQGGEARAGYGEQLLERLEDLTQRFGRGFSRQNLQQMRQFYSAWPPDRTCQTASGKFEDMHIHQPPEESGRVQALLAASVTFDLAEITRCFLLSWSHYIKLLAVRDAKAREFYEAEALRGGWTVRQLDRQIGSQFYQRTLLLRNKAAMLTKGAQPCPEDAITPEEELKDPLVLEFLNLKDEYSESELEDALIRYLEAFLLELGNDFTFVGRQKRLRIDDEWYRVDLVFYHRRLRCLVIIDLKLDKLTHADVGQMHLYCNYARAHWTLPDENPPVGLILCTGKGAALARYALEGLPNKIMATEYLTALPPHELLEAELDRTRRILTSRNAMRSPKKTTASKRRTCV